MPMAMLGGDGTAYREQLLTLGLRIAPGRRARDRLHEYISSALPAARARCVPCAGWHRGVYVLPDATFPPHVRLFIAEHGASRFERQDGDTVHNRAGWLRDRDGEREYLILPTVWRAEVCTGHDAGAIAAALAEAGHLRRGGDRKPQRTERLPGVGPQRIYVLRASILGEGGDDA